MNLFGNVLEGLVLDNARDTVQICFLKYINKRMSGAKKTKNYEIDMGIAEGLLYAARNRFASSRGDTSSTQQEIWQYELFRRVLGKLAPYDSLNSNVLTVFEWSLQSSVREAFIFNKIQFDTVTVLIENDMEHWFGTKFDSVSAYTYQRSRPRPRALMDIERSDLPKSPIVLAANNRYHKSKCNNCGECDQIVLPMETYYFKKTCKNPKTEVAREVNAFEPVEECTGNRRRTFISFKKMFKLN